MLRKPDICSSMDAEDDILADIRLSWVDDPNPIHFRNHRALTRYARELKMLTLVMKDYSRLSYKVDQNLLDRTLKYGLNAHTNGSRIMLKLTRLLLCVSSLKNTRKEGARTW